MKKTLHLTAVFLVAALPMLSFSGCVRDEPAVTEQPRVVFYTSRGEVAVTVEVARSDAERSKGLMGRPSLEAGQGMIFIWDSPTQQPFWMKDTLIPLSIAFIASDGTVIDIQDMEPLTLTHHSPPGPYIYAIEVNGGFFEKNGVRAGDRARVEGI